MSIHWAFYTCIFACLGGVFAEVEDAISFLQLSTSARSSSNQNPTNDSLISAASQDLASQNLTNGSLIPLNLTREDLVLQNTANESLVSAGGKDLVSQSPTNDLQNSSNQKAKVAFGLFTSPLEKYKERMAAIDETWGREVAPSQFIVVDGNSSIPNITSRAAKQCPDTGRYPSIICKQATLIATGFEQGVDWLVVLNDDHYVFPRHWEELLEQYDPQEKLMVGEHRCGGGKFCEDGKSGLCGGSSYAVSRGALQAMVGKYTEAPKENYVIEDLIASIVNKSPWGDQIISCVARRSQVKEVPFVRPYRGLMERPRNNTHWRDVIRSPDYKPVAFHYVKPDQMREIHEMTKVADQARLMGLMAPEESFDRLRTSSRTA